jgi:hypothetical protein
LRGKKAWPEPNGGQQRRQAASRKSIHETRSFPDLASLHYNTPSGGRIQAVVRGYTARCL